MDHGSINQWKDQAHCKGHANLFYGPDGEFPRAKRRREQLAINICNDCPVKAQCLTWALENEGYGIWGAMTEQQRIINGGSNPRTSASYAILAKMRKLDGAA